MGFNRFCNQRARHQQQQRSNASQSRFGVRGHHGQQSYRSSNRSHRSCHSSQSIDNVTFPKTSCRATYDTSKKIQGRNPLSKDQIASKLGVKNPASNEDLNITKKDGKLQVTLEGPPGQFRVGYTTHDKAFSRGGDYSSSDSVLKAEIPGRYSISVEELSNGQVRYTLTLDQNLSGATLDLGGKKYVIPNTEPKPAEKQMTLGEYLESHPQSARSASDKLPIGMSYKQYMGVEPIPKELKDKPLDFPK